MKLLAFNILIFITTLTLSSQTVQISGFIKDKDSGDNLPAAHIYFSKQKVGLISNEYGYFSTSVDKGLTPLVVSYTGCTRLDTSFVFLRDTTLVIQLRSNNTIDEVEVKGSRFNSRNNVPGKMMLSKQELEVVATLMGEKDIFKVMQLLPGIKPGKDGQSGMYVRGGSPGQNLVLLDGVTVYNMNHLYSFFSVFTPEAIKSVEIYKGAFPAKYGGRVSSVTDIQMREGNLNNFHADVSIGTISSKATVETPIVKGQSSILVSARRSYIDLFLYPFQMKANTAGKTETWGYYFYDLNLKFASKIAGNGKFFLSYYSGKDKYHENTKTQNVNNKGNIVNPSTSISQYKGKNHWGNNALVARFYKPLANKLFLNTNVFFTRYQYELYGQEKRSKYARDTVISEASYLNNSFIQDIGGFINFNYYHSNKQTWSGGLKLTRHTIQPSETKIDIFENTGFSQHSESGTNKQTGVELEGFLEGELQLLPKLKLVPGVHYSNYNIDDYTTSSVQPRFYAIFNPGKFSYKYSVGYMFQPIMNIINNSLSFPVDIWVSANQNIKPTTSFQTDFTCSYDIADGYKFEIDAYWRKTDNIITYANGQSFFSLTGNWYDKVISGESTSYGSELLLKKTSGKTSGWIGYTLSKSQQQFDELNNGKPFPFTYDRLHYLTITVNHQFNSKLILGGSWVCGSGAPFTASTTAYVGDDFYGSTYREYYNLGIFTTKVYSPNELIYYSGMNEKRLPAYHRLDIGLTLRKEIKQGIREWNFSIYNVYARNNPFMVHPARNSEGEYVLKNQTLFRFLPSLSYRIKI